MGDAKDDYESAVDAFLDGPFAASNVDSKLAAWSAQIDPIVNEASDLNGAPTYADWQAAYQMLESIIGTAWMHRGYPYDAMPMSMSASPSQPSMP